MKDGTYAVAGDFSKVVEGLDSDSYLEKTDPAGNTVWNKTFDLRGRHECEVATSVRQTSEGGYIVAGGKQPSERERLGLTYTPEDAYLIKTDENGNI